MCVGLQFIVKAARDPRFERRGADLFYNASISMVDALVGFSTQVRVIGPCCCFLKMLGIVVRT